MKIKGVSGRVDHPLRGSIIESSSNHREALDPKASAPKYCPECKPGGGVADRAFRVLEQAHVAIVGELLAACREGLELGEIAVRAGLDGFSQEDEDSIVREHVKLKRLRAAIARAEGK